MNYHSDNMVDNRIKMRLANVIASSYESKSDGCLVTSVRCSRCAMLFEEELETAKAKVLSGVDMICIKCDDDALQRPVCRAVVSVVWFVLFWACLRCISHRSQKFRGLGYG